jgi:DNA-binding PadR family transcriptional regulator
LAEKKRFSSEYTMLAILEYLCTESRTIPISKYHIISKIPAIKKQRPDRIVWIIDTLEKNGLIKSIKTSNVTYYTSTEKGHEAYLQWAQKFLDFARAVKEKE